MTPRAPSLGARRCARRRRRRRPGREADRGLLAVQHVAVAVATSPQRRLAASEPPRGSVRPSATTASPATSSAPRRRPAAARPAHDRAHQRGRQLHVADVEVAVGDLLGDQAGRTPPAQAAILLGQVDAEQAEAAHLAAQAAVGRQLLVLALLVAGQQALAGEAAARTSCRVCWSSVSSIAAGATLGLQVRRRCRTTALPAAKRFTYHTEQTLVRSGGLLLRAFPTQVPIDPRHRHRLPDAAVADAGRRPHFAQPRDHRLEVRTRLELRDRAIKRQGAFYEVSAPEAARR